MDDVLFKCRGLRRTYGAKVAVDHLDLTIHRGEIFGLLGTNGAGKSTTISMIAGEVKPDRGRIWFAERKDRMLGVVPQELAIYDDLKIEENVKYFATLYVGDKAKRTEQVEWAMAATALTGMRGRYARELSGGQKRRLNLAIGLVHRPRFLILDEPTVGVDLQSRQLILKIIREYADAGNAVLYTTHYLEEAEILCDRLAVMNAGKLLFEGRWEELPTAQHGDHTDLAHMILYGGGDAPVSVHS